MSSPARHAFVRVCAVLFVSIFGFLLIEQPFRVGESHAVSGLLLLVGADGTHVPYGSVIEIFPSGHPALLASITMSCSSLSSLLAIACLAFLGPDRLRRRWWSALAIALGVVALGNILRIALSLGAGLLAGRSALILFHDWVGGVFAFTYTLGGYILFLYLVLPNHDQPQRETRDALA
jgi:carbamoyl-phosphate synthase large subunit